MEMALGAPTAWIAALPFMDLEVSGEQWGSLECRLQDLLEFPDLLPESLAEFRGKRCVHTGMTIYLVIPFFKGKIPPGVKI